MTCAQRPEHLDAYIDGQLNLVSDRDAIAQISTHVAHCEQCAAEIGERQQLSNEIRTRVPRFAASALLHEKMRAAIANADASRTLDRPPGMRARQFWKPLALAASLLLAVVTAHDVASRPHSQRFVDQSIIDAHTQSLRSSHLFDVASSDRHTVKPWFDGKLNFSPPVFDLAEQGFPLAGGRVDHIDSHEAAALVFHRGQHPINLFITLSSAAEQPTEGGGSSTASSAGFNIVHWHRGQFRFAAVSSLNATELAQFADLYMQRDTVRP